MNNYVWFLVAGVFIASCSQILLKTGAMQEQDSWIKEYLNWRVITGYLLMMVSTVMTILAFRRIDYKNGPVIESVGYIFVMILSCLILKEKITKKKLLGNAMILLGIFVYYM